MAANEVIDDLVKAVFRKDEEKLYQAKCRVYSAKVSCSIAMA